MHRFSYCICTFILQAEIHMTLLLSCPHTQKFIYGLGSLTHEKGFVLFCFFQFCNVKKLARFLIKKLAKITQIYTQKNKTCPILHTGEFSCVWPHQQAMICSGTHTLGEGPSYINLLKWVVMYNLLPGLCTTPSFFLLTSFKFQSNFVQWQ
jgi:hypothetical protein